MAQEAAAGAMLVGAGVKTYMQYQAGNAQIDALRLQQTQERLKATTAANQQLNQVQRIVSAQTARIGASGTTAGSASNQAIQGDTFNQGAQDLKTQDINEAMKQAALSQDISNVKTQQTADIFTNLFDVGSDFFNPKQSFGGSTDYFNPNQGGF